MMADASSGRTVAAPAARRRWDRNAGFTRPADDLSRRCRLKAAFRRQGLSCARALPTANRQHS